MEGQKSVFEYMYRDAGNFKTYGALLLEGDCCEALEELRAYLESGYLFVAEQVGVPSLCSLHWKNCCDGPSDLDHAYHEFVGLRLAEATDNADLSVCGSLNELLALFRAASGRWDVSLSPNCYL